MLTKSKSQAKEPPSRTTKLCLTTCGIRNARCSCYLNCLLQIIANLSPIFLQINQIKPNSKLDNCIQLSKILFNLKNLFQQFIF